MKCQKCGTEHNANFCPNCGVAATQPPSSNFRQNASSNFNQTTSNNNYQVYTKKKNSTNTIIIVLVVLIVFLVIMIGALFGEDTDSSTSSNMPASASSSEPEIEYIEISAESLFAAYEENEIAADEKYTDEYLKVTGIVSEINSDDFLTSNNVLLTVKSSVFGCVQCNFNSENAKALVNVQKGQQITVTGTCGGLDLFNIMINGCELQ